MNEFIARNGFISQENSVISGSLTITEVISGSLFGTSSYSSQALNATNAVNATNLNGRPSSDFVLTSATSSFITQNQSTDSLLTKANIESPTFTGTVSGITKTMVGLGNIDNTTDANKPVSTAGQTALNLKANIASPTFTGAVTSPSFVGALTGSATTATSASYALSATNADTLDGNHASAFVLNSSTGSFATQAYVSASISNLVDSSPATLDTLNELAAALGDDPNFATTVTNSIGTKLSLAGGTMSGAIAFVAGQTWPTFNQNTTGTAATLTTTRTFQIGNTGKTFNGSANVSWTLAEIGAQAALTNPVTGTGTTNYLPKFTGTSTIGNSLVFDNGTNVGIGTTTPQAKLDINGGSLPSTQFSYIPTQVLRSANGNSEQVEFGTLRTTTGSDWTQSGFRIQEKIDSTWMAFMQFNGTGNQYGISFGTGASSTSRESIPERIRITGTGNVGIGTTSPSAKLDVSGSTNLNGNTIVTGSLIVTGGITGTLTGNATTATSASYALNATTAPNYLPLTGGTLTGNLTTPRLYLTAGGVYSNMLTTGNTQVFNPTGGLIYVGNPSTTLNLESNTTIKAYRNGANYTVYDSGNFTSGTGSTNYTAGNDSRLSDARTPSNDSNLVHIAGDETIYNVKNFVDKIRIKNEITGQGGSSAALQVNGFMRTGNIYLHPGGNAPDSTRVGDVISNESGSLTWTGVGSGTVLTSGNYNSYAPTKAGIGATGSWGISITGNATTATSASYAQTSTNSSLLSGVGIIDINTITNGSIGTQVQDAFDFNLATNSGVYNISWGGFIANAPSSWAAGTNHYGILVCDGLVNNRFVQTIYESSGPTSFYRVQSGPTWGAWVTIVSSANISNQSVSYANNAQTATSSSYALNSINAINADTVDGNHASAFVLNSSTGSFATQTYVNTAVSNLVDSSPTTLDTLNELAAALGDDPNFATTVTNSIGTKLSLAGGTMSGAIAFVAGQTWPTFNQNTTGTAATLTTTRTFQIGNTGKNFNGSANVSWTLAEIGAQAALTNPVTGTGTANYLPKFTGTSAIGNSALYESGSNVGIGTASPTQGKLQIQANTSDSVNLYLRGQGLTSGNNTKINFGNTNNAFISLDGTANFIRMNVDGTLALISGLNKHITLVPDGTGNVGIGTVSPVAKLQVIGNIFSTGNIRIEDSGDHLEFINSNVGIQRTENFLKLGGYGGIIFTASQTGIDSQLERMRITDAGNVGIGTTTPSAKLDVNGDAKISSDVTLSNYTDGVLAVDSVGLIKVEPTFRNLSLGESYAGILNEYYFRNGYTVSPTDTGYQYAKLIQQGLLNKASLLLMPQAVKPSLLALNKPNIDMDVVRATTATRVNSLGLIENVASNVARLNYEGDCPSILLEPQRTNLVSYSEQFDNNFWNKQSEATVMANTTNSPSGVVNAETLSNATGTGVTGNVLRLNTQDLIDPIVWSVYVKSLGASTVSLYIRNGSNGAIITSNHSIDNMWKRISVTGVVRNGQITIGGTNGDVAIWGAQLEQGSYPTSYIPTVASTVTRNADVISKTGISDLIGQTEGVLFVESAALANDLTNRAIAISDGTGANRLYLYYSAQSNVVSVYGHSNGVGFNDVINYTLTDETQFTKIAIRYKANNISLWINGINRGTLTSQLLPVNLSRFGFDSGSSGSTFYGKTKQVQLYKTYLTDSEMANLTTL